MLLQMENGQVTKKTTSVDLTGGTQVSQNPWTEEGYGLTWQQLVLQFAISRFQRHWEWKPLLAPLSW